MLSKEWILCPICGNKTRVRIRKDTELKNFPLYCPKCSRESLIEVKNDIVNIGLHFILKNIRPYAASCSEA